MTSQEIFNQIVQHLRTQNARAVNSFGECFYQNTDSLKCAIGGILMPEELATKPSGDVKQMLELSTTLQETKDRLLPHLDLLIDLQCLHDSDVPEFWEEGFKKVAIKYNLTIPERTL